MLGTVLQDLRYAARTLRKTPGFTAVAVSTLALGIGATTTILGVISGVLLRPLDYPGSERMVHVWERGPQRGIDFKNTSPPNFREWQAESRSFEVLGFYGAFAGNLSYTFILTGDGPAERLRGRFVSSGFFRVFGVQPMLGRTFAEDEDNPGGARVVILSHRLWQRRFGGDPAILEKSILLENFGSHSYQVVGVMPTGFDYPAVSLWVAAGHMHQDYSRRGSSPLHVMGRLKPGVSLRQAELELGAIQRRIAETHPQILWMGTDVRLLSFHEAEVRGVRESLLIFLCAVLLVLFIACANVANLLLARALARRKEIAVRTALGAGRWRIIRQLLIESVTLSMLGGAAGVLLAVWGTKLVVYYSAGTIPRAGEVGVDLRALGLTVVVSTLTGLLFGLVPALQTGRINLTDGLKEGGQSLPGGTARRHTFSVFTVAQIALAVMLMIGAGLMMRSFARLQGVDPGFDTRNVLTVDVDMAGAAYESDVTRRVFFQQLLQQLRAVPGVEAACGVCMVPDRGDGWATAAWRADRPTPRSEQRRSVAVRPVTPGYLATYGIALLKGRELTDADTSDASRVVMVNKAFADAFFPNDDPVGRQIVCNGVHEIVGLVANVKNGGLAAQTKPEVYTSYLQWPWPSAFLSIRTKSDTLSLAPVITERVRALNPNQPLAYFRTMEEYVSEQKARPRFRSLVIGAFAIAALVLASVGIYGVMSYSVTQRTKEIGIRLALGAQKRDVLLMVLSGGLRLVISGLVLGLAGGVALTRFLRSQLYGVAAHDPATYTGVAILLTLVALVACLLPAYRATRVDPMVALRQE